MKRLRESDTKNSAKSKQKQCRQLLKQRAGIVSKYRDCLAAMKRLRESDTKNSAKSKQKTMQTAFETEGGESVNVQRLFSSYEKVE